MVLNIFAIVGFCSLRMNCSSFLSKKFISIVEVLVVVQVGGEPTCLSAQHFKCCAYTSSATGPFFNLKSMDIIAFDLLKIKSLVAFRPLPFPRGGEEGFAVYCDSRHNVTFAHGKANPL